MLKPVKIIVLGFVLMIGFGVYLTYYYYDNSTYPLQETRGLLDRIQTTTDTQVIIECLNTIKVLLPQQGNPVWIFPTETTDFGLIQKDLDAMIADANMVSTAPLDSTDFYSKIMNVHEHSSSIKLAILDAVPYVYTDLSFVFATLIWMVGLMGLTEVLRQKFP